MCRLLKIWVSCFLSFFALIGSVNAIETTVSVRTLGVAKCQNVMSDINSASNKGDMSQLYVQWLSGYISAYNIQNNLFDAFPVRHPVTESFRFFLSLCAVNPNKSLVQVVNSGLEALKSLHIKKPSVEVEVDIQGKKYIFYKTYMESAQFILRNSGQRIIVDGLWGRATERGFRQYKLDKELPGPPVPDYTFLLHVLEKKSS
jgi:SAM-dependent MidA family methyltransferase